MTDFIDAIKDIRDVRRITDALATEGLGSALDFHQKMKERQQLRDLAAAAQESVKLQREQQERAAKEAATQRQRDAFSASRDSFFIFRSDDPDTIISVLEQIAALWPYHFQKATAQGIGSAAEAVAYWESWKKKFDDQVKKEHASGLRLDAINKELDRLRVLEWFPTKETKQKIASLESERDSIPKQVIPSHDTNWGGPRYSKDEPITVEVCKHFGFGPKEDAARDVYGLHYKYRGVLEDIERKRRRAEDKGLLSRLDELLANMRTMVDGAPAPSSGVSDYDLGPEFDEYARQCNEQLRNFVLDKCLKSMCLVAAVDKTLGEAEVRRIVDMVRSRGVSVEPQVLVKQVVATCKNLAATGYSSSAQELVAELQPYKGTALGNLVVELMEEVSTADGAMGNRERRVVEHFRRNLGAE